MHTDRLTRSDVFGSDIFNLAARLLMLPPADARAPGSRTPAARPEASRAPVQKLSLPARFERWLAAQERRGIEAYLAKSVDIYDLEARMRAIERGEFRPWI